MAKALLAYVLDLAKVLIVWRLGNANADAEQCEGHEYHANGWTDVEQAVGNDMRQTTQIHW